MQRERRLSGDRDQQLTAVLVERVLLCEPQAHRSQQGPAALDRDRARGADPHLLDDRGDRGVPREDARPVVDPRGLARRDGIVRGCATLLRGLHRDLELVRLEAGGADDVQTVVVEQVHERDARTERGGGLPQQHLDDVVLGHRAREGGRDRLQPLDTLPGPLGPIARLPRRVEQERSLERQRPGARDRYEHRPVVVVELYVFGEPDRQRRQRVAAQGERHDGEGAPARAVVPV